MGDCDVRNWEGWVGGCGVVREWEGGWVTVLY